MEFFKYLCKKIHNLGFETLKPFDNVVIEHLWKTNFLTNSSDRKQSQVVKNFEFFKIISKNDVFDAISKILFSNFENKNKFLTKCFNKRYKIYFLAKKYPGADREKVQRLVALLCFKNFWILV